MTTIGYGDYSAVKRPEYDSADNMELISFIQFTAIFTFTLIQASMLSLVFDISMSTVLKKARFDAQDFLLRVEQTMRRQWDHAASRQDAKTSPNSEVREPLPKFIYDEVMNNVVTATRHSCYTAFVQEPYYAELPPALQSKLLAVCLSRI